MLVINDIQLLLLKFQIIIIGGKNNGRTETRKNYGNDIT